MIYVNTKKFRETCAAANRAVASKSPKPILTCLKIDASGNRLTAAGSDLEVHLEASCECECHSPLATCLPARQLLQWLACVNSETIQIRKAGNKIELISASYKSSFTEMPADEFPAPPEVTGETWELPATALRAGLRVVFAADETSARYVLSGVCFDRRGGQRYIVACDGRRLACQELGSAEGADSSLILPESASKTLAAILPDSGTAELTASENLLSVRCGDTLVVARLLSGLFVDWTRAVPDIAGMVQCHIDASELANAIRSSMVAVNEETKGVTLRIGSGELTLTASTGSGGVGADASIPIAQTETREAMIQPAYAAQFLATLPQGATVQIAIENADRPVRLTHEQGNYWTIIMPLSKER